MPWIAKSNIQVQTKARGVVDVSVGNPLPSDAVVSANIGLWCYYQIDVPEDIAPVSETQETLRVEAKDVRIAEPAKRGRRKQVAPPVDITEDEEV
jgi:hypothetical protein